MNQSRIGLDVDGVLANFIAAMITRLQGTKYVNFLPKSHLEWTTYSGGNWVLFNEAMSTFKDDPFFWSSIPKMDDAVFSFNPYVYITARPVPSYVTKGWIRNNRFPVSPVFTVSNPIDKLRLIQHCQLDAFVEDYHKTAIELNEAGIKCYLLNRPWNVNEPTPGVERINSLCELDDLYALERKAA